MRARTILGVVVLLLPSVVSAQRLPIGGRRGPTRPAELPPQPPEIAYMLAVKRSHFTVETYPFVSRVQSPGYMANGLISSWTTLGTGTRFDYRINDYVSGTFDLTTTVVGGPSSAQTGELGTRFHRARTDSKFYPFADARVGYIYAYDKDPRAAIADVTSGIRTTGPVDRYAQGVGAVGGIGTEYALGGSWALTTEASVLRNRMTEMGLHAQQSSHRSYGMTWYRYTLGVSYNPVRLVRAPSSDTR